MIINDDSLVQKARYLINFGIENTESIPDLGTNAKMNEFEAAMGLCVLDDIDDIMSYRKNVCMIYETRLRDFVLFQKRNRFATPNYSYFPIVLNDEATVSRVIKALNKKGIFPRRYFNPSLDSLNYIDNKNICKTSRELCQTILALPCYPKLSVTIQNDIIDTIKENLQNE